MNLSGMEVGKRDGGTGGGPPLSPLPVYLCVYYVYMCVYIYIALIF